MKTRIFSELLLVLLLAGLFASTFNVQLVESVGTPPSVDWSYTFGGAGNDFGGTVIQTKDGGYAFAGGTYSYGAGSSDAWLVKTNPSGLWQWDQTYGGPSFDGAGTVVQTTDDGYAITATTYSYGISGYADFWLIKTVPGGTSGTVLWDQTYGTAGYEAASAGIQTSTGEYALIGAQFLGVSADFWLVKTFSNGIQDWTQTDGGAGHDWGTSLVETTTPGEYALAGYTDSKGNGAHDFWLIKTSSSGGIWDYTFGGSDEDWCYDVIQTNDQGYALIGETRSKGAGDYDVWLVKTDQGGNWVWDKTFGGAGWDGANSVIQTTDGGYALVGWTQPPSRVDWDLWVIKTDSSGNLEWDLTLGGTGDDWGNSLVQTTDGGYALVGVTNSYGSGGYDAWLIKLLPAIPVRSLNKTMNPPDGKLGDVIHVTLTIVVPSGETAIVVDTLPTELSYIWNTFKVTPPGATATPQVTTTGWPPQQQIKYSISAPGTYTIEFDVRVTSASWQDRTVINRANATWYGPGETKVDEKEATADFVIHPFRELHKNVGIPMADVVFAIDLTDSMRDEIAVVKTEAINIMNALTTTIANVKFGLISFEDYDGVYIANEPLSNPPQYISIYGWPGDVPYTLEQDLTPSTTLVATKIAGLTVTQGSGADFPEPYTRIIHESWNAPNLNWRFGAKKFLILFGDDVTHDTNFDYNNDGNKDNTGFDPGRDGAPGSPASFPPGTGDELDFQTEVANAKAHGIHIMAVYSGAIGYGEYEWQYMGTETGGGYFELGNATQIPAAIKDLITEQALTIKEKTNVQWAVIMDVINPFSFTMTDIAITDNLPAEIEIDEPFPYSITHGTVSYKLSGKTKSVDLTWKIRRLQPGETARLTLLVSTDVNPGGKQEYNEPGRHLLNPGAKLKFLDPELKMRLSAETAPVYATVLPARDP